MSKKIKATLFAAFVMTVLCAGTVSARQLQKSPSLIGVCRGSCSRTVPCTSGPCFCYIPDGKVTGSCVSDPP
jgi:hypothetical protein